MNLSRIGNSGYDSVCKYIVDIAGELPTILLEIEPSDGSLKKSYVYANGEILMQYNGSHMADKYFYLHDRLGSVRQLIGANGSVVHHYTYDPFAKTIEESTAGSQDPGNAFMFTGQYYDSEIGQYYLRARQYDPQLMRFTGRDPLRGQFTEPMTLHRYLYCNNDPIDFTDPSGNRTMGELLATVGTIGTAMANIANNIAIRALDQIRNFTNAINVMNTWSDKMMTRAGFLMDDCYFSAANAMNAGKQILGTVATRGWEEVAMFGEFLKDSGIYIANGTLQYAKNRPEGAVEVLTTIAGAPDTGAPQTPEGFVTTEALGFLESQGVDVDSMRDDFRKWFWR